MGDGCDVWFEPNPELATKPAVGSRCIAVVKLSVWKKDIMRVHGEICARIRQQELGY
jgi:hypothetical protein